MVFSTIQPGGRTFPRWTMTRQDQAALHSVVSTQFQSQSRAHWSMAVLGFDRRLIRTAWQKSHARSGQDAQWLQNPAIQQSDSRTFSLEFGKLREVRGGGHLGFRADTYLRLSLAVKLSLRYVTAGKPLWMLALDALDALDAFGVAVELRMRMRSSAKSGH